MFSVSVLAGSVSTTVFVASTLPMLIKAARTKDLGSYSVGNLVLANLGNLVYAVYVVSLPVGPIWALHSFYMVSSFAMLVMWLNYRRRLRLGIQPDAPPPGIHGDAPRRADRALPRRRHPRSPNGRALFGSLVLGSSARDPGQVNRFSTVGGATAQKASRQIALSSAELTSASSTPSQPRWPT